MNTGNKISFTIVGCTILLAMIILLTSFLQMKDLSPVAALPTAQAIVQPTTIPTAQPVPQNNIKETSARWEYISLSYSQGNTYDEDVTRYETVNINEPYQNAFDQILYKGCSNDKDIFTCIGKNFQGLEFFLDVLGKDGWEAIGFANTSDQYKYSIDVVFKRAVR
jgi:hypothetical protein